MTEQTAQWWYENDGQQAGPIPAGMLQGLIQSGQVRPTARVWRAGMAGWEQIAKVPELAAQVPLAPPRMAPPPIAPPAAGLPGSGNGGYASPAQPAYGAEQPAFGAPAQGGFGARPQPALGGSPGAQPAYPAAQQPYPQQGYARPQQPLVFEEISVGMLILLTVVTFGIYGMIKFFQTGKGYEQLAGRESRFATYFWLYLGLSLGALFVNLVAAPLGVLCSIAGIVFGVLTLFEALKLRDEGVRRYQVNAEITGEGTHKVLYILGVVLSVVVVGVILMVIQAVKWFEDWNQIARGLGPRRF
jgi:hypothetical protein